MKGTKTRRSFIRDTSLTSTGLFLASVAGTNHKSLKELAIGCAPAKASLLTGSISSVKSGNWSDPATWGGRVPATSDTPLISAGHVVTYDVTTFTASGININAGGTLQFDSSKSVTLQTNKNVVVEGTLVMRPNSVSIIHTLRFVDVNENNFIGGGMEVKATDVGLWVMGPGKLDLQGAVKQAWSNLTGSVTKGSSSVTVKNSANWAVGDEIFICPTRTPPNNSMDYNNGPVDSFAPEFERRIITAVNGTTLSFAQPLAYDHMQVVTDAGKTWTGEVGNLTRNVRVEGTASGKAHTFIMSSSPHTIKNVALRYMGPRKNQRSTRGDMVAGRYALHFHHCNNGSIGSQVTGCVVYDTGNHAYVPHVSHGVNMSDNIAFNCYEMAFWWDFGDLSHDINWSNNLIALNTFINGTADMAGTDRGHLTSGGMLLGMGDGCIARGNVCVYAGVGDPHTQGAFIWEANNEGIWVFENNLAHSNHIGIRIWQNTVRNHTIINQDCYNNGVHLFHGAYANAYTYRGGVFYNGETHVKASSANSAKMQFEKVVFDTAGNHSYAVEVQGSPIPNATHPNIFRQCTFKNYKVSAVHIYTPGPVGVDVHNKYVDLIHCTFSGKEYTFQTPSEPNSFFRVQHQSGQPKKIGWDGLIKDVLPFSPVQWGDGMGLKGEYYNDASLSNKVFERTDSVVMFSEWSGDRVAYNLPLGVHHKITGYNHSVRWTGKVRAQHSEPYVLRVQGSGGFRLWLDGKMLIDKWTDVREANYSTAQIPMVAGTYYDLKVEYFNVDSFSGALLFWKCPSMELEVLIPQSQLYSTPVGDSTTPEEPNKGPVANAGTDITLTLPINNTVLNGTSSNDPDGTLASYKWTKISGPGQFTLSSDTQANATLSNLAEGVYTFRLEVKDNKGAVATDDVLVTVNAAVANKGPVANAGPDATITLPNNKVTLNGSGSSDTDGKIVSYLWTKTNGPSQFSFANANGVITDVTNLAAGTYTFRLQVTDDKGAVAVDDIVVTVVEGANRGPFANAGADVVITLPVNLVNLSGTMSSDPDGSISAYNWTKISGPTQFSFSNANAATTTVNNLVEGVYVFRLKVTDNRGATATDDVTVTVNRNLSGSGTVSSQSLSITAGPNPSTSSFKVQVRCTNSRPIRLRVYDQWMNQIASYENIADVWTLTLGSAWRPGTYFVMASQGQEVVKVTLLKLPS